MRAHLIVAFVGIARAAAAAPMADVVVAWGPAPLGKLGEAVGDAASRAGASYIDATPGAQPLPDPRPLIKRGMAAYTELEFEASASALDTAAELVDQTGAAGVDSTQLADLFLYRSLANEQRNDETRSWEDLVIAAAVAPARVLDPAGFPPRSIERFGKAKAHVAALPRGRVKLVGVGCSVRVDGAAGPNESEIDLPFGRHWIASTCEGRLPVRRRITVDQTAMEIVVAGPAIAPPDDAALTIQARTAAAHAIVVVTVQGGVAVVRRIGIDGKQQDRVSVAADRPRAVGEAVGRLLAPPEVHVAQPWYRSKWVWAAGGVLAASAVLIPLAARSGGEAPRVDATLKGVPASWFP